MLPASLTWTDFYTGIFSMLFTVMILSYIVGDNFAFRLAIHVFIGVSAGYVTLVILQQVIVNEMIVPLFVGSVLDRVLVAIPLVLGLVLVITHAIPSLESAGRWLVAFLVGTGAAAAVAGAIIGTLVPQVASTINLFDMAGGNLGAGIVILLGTIVTLAYFQFTVIGKDAPAGKRGLVMKVIAILGQVFIVITLGALFAGAFSAALTAFTDRIYSIIMFLDQLFF